MSCDALKRYCSEKIHIDLKYSWSSKYKKIYMKRTNQQINKQINKLTRGFIISSGFCCKMYRVWFQNYLLRWALATLAKLFLGHFQHYVYNEVPPFMSHLMPVPSRPGKTGPMSHQHWFPQHKPLSIYIYIKVSC